MSHAATGGKLAEVRKGAPWQLLAPFEAHCTPLAQGFLGEAHGGRASRRCQPLHTAKGHHFEGPLSRAARSCACSQRWLRRCSTGLPGAPCSFFPTLRVKRPSLAAWGGTLAIAKRYASAGRRKRAGRGRWAGCARLLRRRYRVHQRRAELTLDVQWTYIGRTLDVHWTHIGRTLDSVKTILWRRC